MKIILDTNVLVSALLSPSGLPARILNSVLDGSVAIVYDNNILAEYADVETHGDVDKLTSKMILDGIDGLCKEGLLGNACVKHICFDDNGSTPY